MPEAHKYWAFISYSHSDGKWGDWLHEALETFPVPAHLAGKPSRDGVVPQRVYPVFRDREELPTSADLGANINSALEQSRYLVVICSPRAATSRWVNEEIRTFKALGKQDRILCLIVDGEPNAVDRAMGAALECFAPALKVRWSPDGAPSTQPVEPIAADARDGKDGSANALLKVLAGLLGVGYDELKQRDQQRQAEARKAQQKAQAQKDLERGRQELAADHYVAAERHFADAQRNDPDDPQIAAALAQARRATAQPCVELAGHTAYVRDIGFSPDGSKVATASLDKTARIWDARSGALLHELAHDDPVRCAQFSPDGSRLVTGGDFDRCLVRIWDTASGKIVHAPERFCFSPVDHFVFDPASPRFVTFTTHDPARLCDLDSGAPLAQFEIDFATFLPDGRLLTGGDDGCARTFDARTGKALEVFGPHDKRVVHARLRGESLMTIHRPFERCLWNVAARTITSRVGVDRLKFVPYFYDVHEFECAAMTEDGQFKVFSLLTRDVAVSVRPHRSKPQSVRFSPDGSTVLTTTRASEDAEEASAKLWDAKTGALREVFGGHVGGTGRAAFSPDGRRVALNRENVVRIWAVGDPPVSPAPAPAPRT